MKCVYESSTPLISLDAQNAREPDSKGYSSGRKSSGLLSHRTNHLLQASGNVGPSIVQALDSNPDFSVSILGRHVSTYNFGSHIPVHRVSDTYPEEELLKAFEGQDAVVSAISLSHVLQQLPLIEAAVKASVRHFIPAEYGSIG